MCDMNRNASDRVEIFNLLLNELGIYGRHSGLIAAKGRF